MEDLSLHILDIVENSLAANASRVEISIVEDKKNDLLSVEINDNGAGMDPQTMEKALDPFYTSKTVRRFGFGLSLLSEAAKAANGHFSIDSQTGIGTRVKADFQHSHIDRKPMGDISQTLITLIMGSPEVDLVFRHKKNDQEYCLDTGEIKRELGEIPISSFSAIRYIKEDLKQWFSHNRI